MFPKLYKNNEANFNHNGLGLLTGSIKAVATEELNGMFELKIEYDNEGFLADLIKEEMIIKAKANDKQDEQLFRIYSITKNHDTDNLIIEAQHITYDLANNFVEKLEASNLSKRQVMESIGSSTAYPHPFNLTSPNMTTRSSTSLYRTNPLQMIGGMEGSVLQIWGGQIERDNFRLIMHDRRGSDDGVKVLYKKNLIGLTAKFDIENLVTRIFPYVYIPATEDEPEQLITVPGKYIDSPYINDYEMPYILPVDYSYEDGVETSQDLLNIASNWFAETGRDKPKVNMEVQFEHLWETEEYKDVAALELVGMGDTITVEHSKLKVEGTAIVNRIEYDVLAGKNIAVDVGHVKARFTDKVNNVVNVVDKVEEIEASTNQALKTANGKNTIYYGSDEPTGSHTEDDLWFRVVDGEYTRTYRFDGIQWQLVVSKDVADIETVANDAHNRANQAVATANLASQNAVEAIGQAQDAFDDAQEALTTAIGASDLASTAHSLATALNTTVSGHSTKIIDIEDELTRKMTTVDADAKYATQSALQQTSQSLSSDIVAVQTAIDDIEIGGRNYLRNTEQERTFSGFTIFINLQDDNKHDLANSPAVVSFYAKHGSDGVPYNLHTYYRTGSGGNLGYSYGKNQYTTEEYERFEIPIDSDKIPSDMSSYVTLAIGKNSNSDRIYIKNIKLEKGNKATDWSPAPEDYEYQFSSINQTVSDITTRVGDSEGNISTLQQTTQSFATRIENAEGDISTLTQTSQGLQTRVADAEDNITSVTQLATGMQTRLTNAEGNINTLTQTATSLESTISSVRDDLDGLEIGGKNYVTREILSNGIIEDGSGFLAISSDSYANYERGFKATGGNNGRKGYVEFTNVFKEKGTYTISFNFRGRQGSALRIKVSLGGQKSSDFISLSNDTYNDSAYTFTATISDTSEENNFIRFEGLEWKYYYFNDIKLEKGNKATDWTPAPEDMATQSQITQLSNNINARVEKGDVINQINISTEDILISGKKLILDGDTTVTGTFRVSNANITSVSADKMTTGTLDAGQVNIINLNASNIKSGTLDAIDITGGRITQQSSGGRVELYDGKIQSYRRNELAIEITGYQMKFYNSDNTEIGSIYPITASGSGNRGIGLEIGDGAHFGVGERIDGVLYGSLGIQPHVSRTYLSGPYKGAIPGATLDLYANRRLLATDNDFTSYDQPAISLRQGQDSNDLIMYYGGANRRADAMLQVRHNFEADSWRSMLTLDSGGLTTRYGVTINNASSVENHGLRLVVNGNNHVITGHTNTSNMIIYPQRITDQDIFRIRSHHLWGNFSNDLRIRYNGDIEGKKFVDSSLAETKENIKPWEISALDIINQSDLYEWTRGSDKKEYGFVIGEGYRTPDEVVSESGSGISNYSHRSLNTKAIQELDTKLNLTREELVLKVAQLEQRINELESVA